MYLRFPAPLAGACLLLSTQLLWHPEVLDAQIDRPSRNTGLQIDTFPRGLAEGDRFVVRLVEANPRARAGRVTVLFLDEHEKVQAEHTSAFGPGAPVTFGISHAELAANGPFPAVRAIVRFEPEGALPRTADFTTRPLVTLEVIDELDFSVEIREYCKPQDTGTDLPHGEPEPNCPPGIVTAPRLAQ
jgi:hypothetical protein